MGKGKRLRKQVNYGDGEVRGAGNDDNTWQENMSEYNSDFSMPSDEDQVTRPSVFFVYFYARRSGRHWR
jgi:hypothetical protein